MKSIRLHGKICEKYGIVAVRYKCANDGIYIAELKGDNLDNCVLIERIDRVIH